MRNYLKLDAWKNSMELTKKIYQPIKSYPKEEQYNLSSQTKRAAVSIAANIAEGMGRQYRKDTLQFLHIARGSVYELETLLRVATMVKILEETVFVEFLADLDSIIKQLSGLIKYFQKAELK